MIYKRGVSTLTENKAEENNEEIVEESGLDFGTILYENTYNDHLLFNAILASDHVELMSESAAINAAKEKGGKAIGSAKEKGGKAVGFAKTNGKKIIDALVSAFWKAVNKVISMIEDAIDSAKNVVDNLRKKFGAAARKHIPDIPAGTKLPIPDFDFDERAYARLMQWADQDPKLIVDRDADHSSTAAFDLSRLDLNSILYNLNNPAIYKNTPSDIKKAITDKIITGTGETGYDPKGKGFEDFGKVISIATKDIAKLVKFKMSIKSYAKKVEKELYNGWKGEDKEFNSALKDDLSANTKAITVVAGAAISITLKRIKHSASVMRAMVRYASSVKKEKPETVEEATFMWEAFLIEAADEVENEINEPEDYKAPEEDCDADSSDNDFSGDEDINNTVTVTVDDSDEVNIEVNGDGDENGPDVQNCEDEDCEE